MKKKLMIVISVMALAGIIGFAVTQTGLVSADPGYTKEDIREQVLKLYPGEITELELEKEGSKAVYEVEIMLDNKEYELKIDGDTAKVLKLEEKIKATQNSASTSNSEQTDDKSSDDTDDVKDKKPITNKDKTDDDHDDQNKRQDDSTNNNTTKDSSSSSDETKAIISTEKAKEIALENFKGRIEEIELDDDDDSNRLIYEVEIINGNQQAEIKIDAYTGEVLILEIETEND